MIDLLPNLNKFKNLYTGNYETILCFPLKKSFGLLENNPYFCSMEIFKEIPNYEGLYEISNYGNVRSIKRPVFVNGIQKRTTGDKLMKPYKMPNGYLHVSLTKDRICSSLRIHRLVCDAFLPSDEYKPDVNHKDGNKENNHLENLERVSRSENMLHAIQNNLTSAFGNSHPRAILTAEKVREIRKRYSEGERQADLARAFHTSDRNIWEIVKNRTWKSIL